MTTHKRPVSADTVAKRRAAIRELVKVLRKEVGRISKARITDEYAFRQELKDINSGCTTFLHAACELRGTRYRYRPEVVHQQVVADVDHCSALVVNCMRDAFMLYCLTHRIMAPRGKPGVTPGRIKGGVRTS